MQFSLSAISTRRKYWLHYTREYWAPSFALQFSLFDEEAIRARQHQAQDLPQSGTFGI